MDRTTNTLARQKKEKRGGKKKQEKRNMFVRVGKQKRAARK